MYGSVQISSSKDATVVVQPQEDRDMMNEFLTKHRVDLMQRCKDKVAARPQRGASEEQLSNGIPMFLDQLTRTLAAEKAGSHTDSLRISGASGGDGLDISELGLSAIAHGSSLLGLGYTVDQVVHDYGDMCQAITDLAFTLNYPFSVHEFRTLNRCLDNAIADSVLEFSSQRDALLSKLQANESKEKLSFLVHELRNYLSTATIAASALEFGNLNMTGSTGSVLKRSLVSLSVLVDQAVNDVRQGASPDRENFSVDSFIEDAEDMARLQADAHDCRFTVDPVLKHMTIRGNRPMLHGALTNLLHNAFRYTQANTEVVLKVAQVDSRILIEVHDHCGGFACCAVAKASATDHRNHKPGLGIGLAIARHSIEADFGVLSVKDMPSVGCVFTMSLPMHMGI